MAELLRYGPPSTSSHSPLIKKHDANKEIVYSIVA